MAVVWLEADLDGRGELASFWSEIAVSECGLSGD